MKIAVISGDWHIETKCVPTVRGGHRIIAAARQSGADISMDDGLAEGVIGNARSQKKPAACDATGLLYMITSTLVLAMVGFNAVFLSANGLFMLAAPELWYGSVPGVAQTGLFNQHFIRDIGIVQLFLGLAFGFGMLRPERRVGLWAAATLWLTAHAGLHLWEVAVGICAPSAILRDFPAVSLPAIFGAILTFWAIKSASNQRKRAVATWRGHASRALSR